jgi:hypothetical protein
MRPMYNRLPWLLALPLMAAGSAAAHAISFAAADPHSEVAEAGEAHARASDGFASHAVLPVALVIAVVACALCLRLASSALGRATRGAGSACFLLLPFAAYGAQELLERGVGAETYPFHAALEPRVLAGLALQLPFGLAAFLLGWFFLWVADGVRRLLARESFISTTPGATRLWIPVRVAATVPRRVLARGHPLRGPPSLA